jgi:hypothetical protein
MILPLLMKEEMLNHDFWWAPNTGSVLVWQCLDYRARISFTSWCLAQKSPCLHPGCSKQPIQVRLPLCLYRNHKKVVSYFYNTPQPGGNRNHKKVVSYFYNTPQPGGNQQLRVQDVKDSEFLYQFPWCRVATAFILQDLNRQRKVEGKVCVASTAANKMMSRYHYTVLGALQYKSAMHKPLHLPLMVVLGPDMHTFILFACKVHGDIFGGSASEKDKCNDIENKVILVSRPRSDLSQTLPLRYS